MALKEVALALCILAAVSPMPAEAHDLSPLESAPPGTQETRYCLKTGTITASMFEQVRCWTRAEWEEKGVDLDKEWAKASTSGTGP